ncbi:hypothetical protein POM88_052576 [Heracleum sosnowskyi]|uniref:Uncharacterized protein n=1 Tax=Heracleum sosnowskyi TaxID=360622 RepID=A0AAD8GSU6_9APIA|nr:hypothetical protein POM88_052576 [Heracleum sosnowskyi]
MTKSCHSGAKILLLQNLRRQHHLAYPAASNSYHLPASQERPSFFICINRQCACCYGDLQEKQRSTSKGCMLLLTEKQVITMEEKERDEAHLHVLQNNAEVYPYIIMHKEYL